MTSGCPRRRRRSWLTSRLRYGFTACRRTPGERCRHRRSPRRPTALGRGDPFGADRPRARRIDGSGGPPARSRPLAWARSRVRYIGLADDLISEQRGGADPPGDDVMVPTRRCRRSVTCCRLSDAIGILRARGSRGAPPWTWVPHRSTLPGCSSPSSVNDPTSPGAAQYSAAPRCRPRPCPQSTTGPTRNRRDSKRALAGALRRRGLLGKEPVGIRQRRLSAPEEWMRSSSS